MSQGARWWQRLRDRLQRRSSGGAITHEETGAARRGHLSAGEVRALGGPSNDRPPPPPPAVSLVLRVESGSPSADDGEQDQTEPPSFRALYWRVLEVDPRGQEAIRRGPAPRTLADDLKLAAEISGARRDLGDIQVHATTAEARAEQVSAAHDPGSDALAAFLLGEGVQRFRPAMELLDRYRRRNSPEYPYEVEYSHLWELYALARVNDYLLLPFQSANPGWDGLPLLSADAYVAFFQGLGFEVFAERPYSPFFHEIVEVEQSLAASERIEITHQYWPGLMYGDLLFSRAGVRVRCRPGILDPEAATRSPLYWAFLRLNRHRADQSDGWGHNSQWRTEFRRDYLEGDHFFFNVDGDVDLGGPELPRISRDADAGLTLGQRRELLVHRCFVTAPYCERRDFYPYRYRLTAEPAASLWPR